MVSMSMTDNVLVHKQKPTYYLLFYSNSNEQIQFKKCEFQVTWLNGGS
jgi:hypothetical protein